MDAIEFINKYQSYLEEIRTVIKPELLPILNDLEMTDPHDLVTPETFLVDGSHARGYVWRLFLQSVKKYSSNK